MVKSAVGGIRGSTPIRAVNNPPRLSPNRRSANRDAREVVVCTALGLVVTCFLAPLAHWQLGVPGVAVVAAALVTMMVAVVSSRWAERLLTPTGGPVSGFLAAMLVRMMVPIVFVLAIVLWNRLDLPSWSAAYIAPLYIALLALETVCAVRRCREDGVTWQPTSQDLAVTTGSQG